MNWEAPQASAGGGGTLALSWLGRCGSLRLSAWATYGVGMIRWPLRAPSVAVAGRPMSSGSLNSRSAGVQKIRETNSSEHGACSAAVRCQHPRHVLREVRERPFAGRPDGTNSVCPARSNSPFCHTASLRALARRINLIPSAFPTTPSTLLHQNRCTTAAAALAGLQKGSLR